MIIWLFYIRWSSKWIGKNINVKLNGSNPPIQFHFFPEPVVLTITFDSVVDIYRCVHSNKIYFAVLSMALNLFFSIFQMKFESFTELWLPFGAWKGWCIWRVFLISCNPVHAHASWLLQEAVVRKPANCKELSLEFLECLKDIIQGKSEGIVVHKTQLLRKSFMNGQTAADDVPKDRGSIASKSQFKKIAFKYGNF